MRRSILSLQIFPAGTSVLKWGSLTGGRWRQSHAQALHLHKQREDAQTDRSLGFLSVKWDEAQSSPHTDPPCPAAAPRTIDGF